MPVDEFTPAQAQQITDRLLSLSNDRFAEELGDAITAQHRQLLELFRDPALLDLSVAAAKALIQRTNNALDRDLRNAGTGPKMLNGDGKQVPNDGASDSAKAAARRAFRTRVGQELAILESLVRERDLRQGITRGSPNPRRRAMERLVQLNLAGDIPKGTFRQLLEEEQTADKAKRAAARARSRRGRSSTRR